MFVPAQVNTLKPDGFTPKIIKQTSDYLYVEYESPLVGVSRIRSGTFPGVTVPGAWLARQLLLSTSSASAAVYGKGCGWQGMHSGWIVKRTRLHELEAPRTPSTRSTSLLLAPCSLFGFMALHCAHTHRVFPTCVITSWRTRSTQVPGIPG
jgi:hypothetical protein